MCQLRWPRSTQVWTVKPYPRWFVPAATMMDRGNTKNKTATAGPGGLAQSRNNNCNNYAGGISSSSSSSSRQQRLQHSDHYHDRSTMKITPYKVSAGGDASLNDSHPKTTGHCNECLYVQCMCCAWIVYPLSMKCTSPVHNYSFRAQID